MNKKGQVIFYTLMLSVALIVLVLALAPTIKVFVDGARNGTDIVGGSGLDCSNSSISDFDKGTCVLTDLSLPTFVGIGLAIAVAIIGARVIFT